jgi:hypothetical protein
MEDVLLEQKAKLASQLSHLNNFINKNKLKLGDVTITGILACKMHEIVDGGVGSDAIEVLVKRKTFMKLAKASEFDNQAILREDFSIRIIRSDEFMDTVCLDKFKVISLNQIVKELKNELNLGTSKKYLKGEFAFNYLVDMVIAQTYAQFNHDSIQREICKKLKCTATDMIRSVHNYIDMNDFIIRKGAIRAYEGELCVIPFNMRDGLLICKGKGNDSWNNSAPHGAGRVLARGKAKNTLSLEEFEEKMKGIYSTSVVKETLDESPMAYKDSEIIEILIDPTVEIVDRIKPILNIKSID